MTAPTPRIAFVEAAPLQEKTAADPLAERARFRNWLLCWLVLPNLPYLPATILGGPPRYPEIVICAAAGLGVRRLPYSVRLAVFLAMMGFMLASFIARMFNMNLTMVLSVAPLVAGINPAASPEYVIGLVLQLVTLAVACWLLRYRSDFTRSLWLVVGIAIALAAAAADYFESRAAMGSYARYPSTDAPFTSATGQAGLLDLADGKNQHHAGHGRGHGRTEDTVAAQAFRRDLATTGAHGKVRGHARKHPILRVDDQRRSPRALPSLGQLSGNHQGRPGLSSRHSRQARIRTDVRPRLSFGIFERHRWYPLVGFRHSIFGDQLLKSGARLCPNVFTGACDRDVPAFVAKQLARTSKPQFIYWLTLNSHLPIVENRALGTENCSRLGGRMDEEFPMVCRLFAVWEDTADSLIRTINRPDFPPTHILIVGDHMPPLTHQASRLQFEPDRVPWILLRSKQPKTET